MEQIRESAAWSVKRGGKTLLADSAAFPMLFVGHGEESVDMYRGNFKIEDYVVERRPLRISSVMESGSGAVVEYGDDLTVLVIFLEVIIAIWP